jgi:hypothetical protein
MEPGTSRDENLVKLINGKPFVTKGVFQLHISEFMDKVDKVIGIVKDDNSVFKFRMLVELKAADPKSLPGDPRIRSSYYLGKECKCVELKFIYMNEEPIDAKIDIGNETKICNNMSSVTFTNTVNVNTVLRLQLSITIEIGQDLVTQEHSLKSVGYSRKFNDEKSSDFKIKCEKKVFHVHQWILSNQSQYFSALLDNDCVETRTKELIIHDFDCDTVELLLRYLYNGTIKTIIDIDLLPPIYPGVTGCSNLMRIADKYNFSSLYATLDSCIAQAYAHNFYEIVNSKCSMNEEKTREFEELLKKGIELVDQLKAPKLAAVIFSWKSHDEMYDTFWSSIIGHYPDFSIVATKTLAREDYRKWIRQHQTWNLCADYSGIDDSDRISIIVGPFGEIKGAVQCEAV